MLLCSPGVSEAPGSTLTVIKQRERVREGLREAEREGEKVKERDG